MSSDSNNFTSPEDNNMAQEEINKNEAAANLSQEQEQPISVSVEPEVDWSAKIAALETKLKEEQDKALRSQAEMMNFRKRQEKERSSWNQMAIKDVISAFLDPLDNLERTVEAAQGTELDERSQALVKGVQIVIQQIQEVLDRKSVVAIFPKGELFNPNEHEAYGQIESSEVAEGHVVTVFRKGYKIGEQLIRTATVQIAKKQSAT